MTNDGFAEAASKNVVVMSQQQQQQQPQTIALPRYPLEKTTLPIPDTTSVAQAAPASSSDNTADASPSTTSTSNNNAERITSSFQSSDTTTSVHSGIRRFSSKDLRGNLTRRQIDRDPFDFYEVKAVIGEGSMGSVCKVQKRGPSVAAASRKSATDRGASLDETEEESSHVCFRLPLVGGLFQNCIKGSIDVVDVTKDLRRSASVSFDDSEMAQQSSHILYAMKSIHFDRCNDPSLIEELKNEVEMLKTLDHPHIVRAIETFEFHNQLFVTMELCSGGDLYSHDPYTEEEAARITMAILSAVHYMHSKGISHRDLKYENILFVNENPLAEVKLIDFGLSRRFGNEALTDGVGTIYTMAPEVLKGNYSKNADLWSVGVIAYMLMSSQMPFYGRNRKEIMKQILVGKFEYKGRRWKRISKQGKAFIDDLLVVDPDDRATSDEAIKASWLNRRFSATARSPHFFEMEMVKNSIVKYADYTKLRRIALMVIAHKSTAAEIGILRKFFQQCDTTGIGHLNYEQFKLAIAAVGYTEQDYRKIFEAVDIDGTEKIRYTEFLAASIEALGPVSEDRIAEAFDQMDCDDTGFITAKNLAAILGDEVPMQEIDAIIHEATSNDDGRISYHEFLGLLEDRDEPNHYAIFRDIMLGGGGTRNNDSERSTNLSAISSEESDYEVGKPIKPTPPIVRTVGEEPTRSVQRTVSTDSHKRVMFREL